MDTNTFELESHRQCLTWHAESHHSRGRLEMFLRVGKLVGMAVRTEDDGRRGLFGSVVGCVITFGIHCSSSCFLIPDDGKRTSNTTIHSSSSTRQP